MSMSAAVPTPSEAATQSLVAQRLLAHADGDRMFRLALGSGFFWANGRRVLPTGLDAAACTVARGLVSDDCDAVAFAFPRGRGPHPAMLGLGLTLWRHAVPHLCGSVVVSTARGELSKELRHLVYDGAEFEKLAAGRLVTESVPGTGGVDFHGNPRPPRKRGAMRPLDRGPRRGLSQADGFLLFARPNTVPPLADNVVSAMVVDTVGTAGPSLFVRADAEPDSWTRTWDTNVAARRKQLWVGELEDPAFPVFCAEHNIPLLNFDWQLIEHLVRDGGTGVGPLTSCRLAQRARQRPAAAYRVVDDTERDYLAREVFMLLSKLRQRGGGESEPDVVRTAYKLCGLLCRLPCTKQAYDEAAGRNRFAETVDGMWNSVNNARSAAFVGRKWKEGFNRYWAPIRSALRKLIRLQEDLDTCSKYEAVIERIGDAQKANERLRIICQTNAERAAVKNMLRDFAVDENQVTVHSFGARFEHGPMGKTVTLLVGPPPPWRAATLVSGEEGRVEVLCYRHEVARLRSRVRAVERSHEANNIATLNRLGVGIPGSANDAEVLGELAELPGYAVREGDEPEDEWSKDVPPPDSTLWQQLLELYGQELPEPDSSDDLDETTTLATTPYDGYARLVRFTDAPPVLFRSDSELDVLLDEEEDDSLTIGVPVGELEEGMTIAFLPGGQRSLLDVLLSRYDQRLDLEAKMFEPLWQRALQTALANEGIDGLMALTDRSRAAVRAWMTGRNIPQQSWRFKKVLEASGDAEATRAQQSLWKYLTATRGPHRHIGKLNRLAIAEAARDDRDQKHLQELERYVGRDLEDLYDQVEPVTVISVSAPMAVPLSHCGRYLPDDDPYLRSCS